MEPERLETLAKPAKAQSGRTGGNAPGTRTHRSPEARREQILQAALTCFGEHGYHASTMDDLVRASGLSKGSLYWHFRSKEEVFLAVFDAFAEELYGQWDAAAESSEEAMSVLQREFELSAEIFSNQRVFLLAFAEFLSHPAARDRMAGTYTVVREKLAAIIERGRRAKSIRSGPPADRLASTLIGAIEGLLLQWLVDPDFDLEGHVEVAWNLLMEGLRP